MNQEEWVIGELKKDLEKLKFSQHYKNKDGFNLLFQINKKEEYWFILDEEKKLIKMEYYGAGKNSFDLVLESEKTEEFWEFLKKGKEVRIRLLFM